MVFKTWPQNSHRLFYADDVTFVAKARFFVFGGDAANGDSIQVTFTLHFNLRRKKTHFNLRRKKTTWRFRWVLRCGRVQGSSRCIGRWEGWWSSQTRGSREFILAKLKHFSVGQCEGNKVEDRQSVNRVSGLESSSRSGVADFSTGITPGNSGFTIWSECVEEVRLSNFSRNTSTLCGTDEDYGTGDSGCRREGRSTGWCDRSGRWGDWGRSWLNRGCS